MFQACSDIMRILPLLPDLVADIDQGRLLVATQNHIPPYSPPTQIATSLLYCPLGSTALHRHHVGSQRLRGSLLQNQGRVTLRTPVVPEEAVIQVDFRNATRLPVLAQISVRKVGHARCNTGLAPWPEGYMRPIVQFSHALGGFMQLPAHLRLWVIGNCFAILFMRCSGCFSHELVLSHALPSHLSILIPAGLMFSHCGFFAGFWGSLLLPLLCTQWKLLTHLADQLLLVLRWHVSHWANTFNWTYRLMN